MEDCSKSDAKREETYSWRYTVTLLTSSKHVYSLHIISKIKPYHFTKASDFYIVSHSFLWFIGCTKSVFVDEASDFQTV
jgi:hypothetical protein